MERISMDRGWLFYSDPGSFSLLGTSGKGGQEVNLPHDAMIGREVSPNALNGRSTGFYEGSAVLYQKSGIHREACQSGGIFCIFGGRAVPEQKKSWAGRSGKGESL